MTTLQLKCVRHLASELAPARGNFYSPRTRFEVRLDRLYRVIALGVFESLLLALVIDETEKPTWLPAGLFDMSSLPLPSDWHFRVLDALAATGGETAGRWIAVWAPPGLVDSQEQIEALIERDEAALTAVAQYVQAATG